MSLLAFRRLRPVGNKIQLHPKAHANKHCKTTRTINWVDCGTSALALAMLNIKHRSKTKHPEVLIPAYCCPDIVSAAVYAGMHPVLVDIAAGRPQFDQEKLSEAISENTCAIVATTFLGIREDFAGIQRIIGDRPIDIIEDSAQWLPLSDSDRFEGHYVVVSFGRGKPLNLLGGGAILTLDALDPHIQGQIRTRTNTKMSELHYFAQVLGYNLLRHPIPYGLLSRLSFVGLGSTTFKTHTEISSMSPAQLKLLAHNWITYKQNGLSVQNMWRSGFAEQCFSTVTDVARFCNVAHDEHLLRYPILMNSAEAREQMLSVISKGGLGGSNMYPTPLSSIPGVARYVTREHGRNNAEDFAARLITLPTHDSVSSSHVEQTLAMLKTFEARQRAK